MVYTLGSRGPSAHMWFEDLFIRLIDTSRDPRAEFYQGQSLSFAELCGNVDSLFGSLPVGADFSTLYLRLFKVSSAFKNMLVVRSIIVQRMYMKKRSCYIHLI